MANEKAKIVAEELDQALEAEPVSDFSATVVAICGILFILLTVISLIVKHYWK